MKRWFVLGLGVLAVACAHMDHPTAEMVTKQRDEVECKALAEQGAPQPGTFFRETLKADLLMKCLESRGWVRVP
jgi:hypothetical protein